MPKPLHELIALLFAQTHQGINLGLDRTIELAAKRGNPHRRFPSIHVAGTNGKGSTCSILASILTEAGYTVGLYTSPHIVHMNERIRIGGATITDDDLYALLVPLVEEGINIGASFFEITTVLAFEYFAKKRVDVAIIETGLGGRLDATNIIEPLASVITQIGLDHTEFLGTTLEQIAKEKAGIIKPGIPVIVQHQPHLHNLFGAASTQHASPITFTSERYGAEIVAWHPNCTMSVAVTHIDHRVVYATNLAGHHQAHNICNALCTLDVLSNTLFVDEAHIERGLIHVTRNTGLIGRIHVVRDSPTTILDVAHNPDGIAALFTTLGLCGYQHRWNVVFGAMEDKNIPEMLRALAPFCGTLFVCAPNYKRAATVEYLAAEATQAGCQSVVVCPNVATAVTWAMQEAQTVICGSFFVAGEAHKALQNN
jgi:dihydrofolate synthase / folylpolyglutamate synthase